MKVKTNREVKEKSKKIKSLMSLVSFYFSEEDHTMCPRSLICICSFICICICICVWIWNPGCRWQQRRSAWCVLGLWSVFVIVFVFVTNSLCLYLKSWMSLATASQEERVTRPRSVIGPRAQSETRSAGRKLGQRSQLGVQDELLRKELANHWSRKKNFQVINDHWSLTILTITTRE